MLEKLLPSQLSSVQIFTDAIGCIFIDNYSLKLHSQHNRSDIDCKSLCLDTHLGYTFLLIIFECGIFYQLKIHLLSRSFIKNISNAFSIFKSEYSSMKL